jgi:hypothetical protein
MDRIARAALTVVLIGFLSTTASAGVKGNGLPPGPRYVLQIIAYENCPAGDFTGSNRHQISVKASFPVNGDLSSNQGGKKASDLIRQNTIGLAPSPDGSIQVMDGNACRGGKDGAEVLLPIDVSATYTVYVRLVGGPNTGIGATTCAEQWVDDNLDGLVDEDEIYILCSTEQVIEMRQKGKGGLKFVDRTDELLTVYADVNGDGMLERVPLFDASLENYFWQWNTKGRAHAQLVFMPNTSNSE